MKDSDPQIEHAKMMHRKEGSNAQASYDASLVAYNPSIEQPAYQPKAVLKAMIEIAHQHINGLTIVVDELAADRADLIAALTQIRSDINEGDYRSSVIRTIDKVMEKMKKRDLT